MQLEKWTDALLNQKEFIIKMALLGAILQLISAINFSLQLLQEFYAYTTGILLNLIYVSTTIQNEFIATNQETYKIIRDCTGWKATYLLLSLLIASGTKYKDFLIKAIYGTVILIVVNIVRLFTTIVFSEKGWISFEIIHNWVWASLMIVAALITWIMLEKK